MSLKKCNLAIRDIRKAAGQYRIWLHLGLLEVRQRYRRSILGPWWITLTMFIFIGAMGTIFGRLLDQPQAEYIPFFTAGFLLWSFISNSLNEATDIFRFNSSLIKQINLPYSIYVFKFVAKSVIYLAHNFIVYLFVMWFFGLNPGWRGLLAIPGLFLLILNLFWMCLLVAILSTRYRDVVQIVNSGLQILFFVTPISWMPKLLGTDSLVVRLNPFVYLIETVRQPLLGAVVPFSTWMININLTIMGLGVGLAIFSAARSRIPFWVE